MEYLKKFFAQIRLWEYVYMTIFLVGLIVAGVLCNSSALVICNSVISIIAIFFLAKGILFGTFLGIANNVLYCIISYQNHFYGEIVCSVVITMPMYLVSIWTWLRNLNKQTSLVKVNRTLSWKEWISIFVVGAVLSVGIFFMLDAFNTANPIVSTISATIGGMAGYLMMRRSEYNFVLYILVNITCVVLWASTLSSNNVEQIPTIIMYCIFLFLNSFGVANWIKLKMRQKNEKEQNIIS